MLLENLPNQDGSHLILLAEDVLANQVLARAQLTKLGYQVKIVSNGMEALKEYKENEYRLILMDCQMPEMDGYTAASTIREEEKATSGHITIIAMTANAMEGDREKCIAAGMDDYISKPITLPRLSEMLEKWTK